MTNDDLTRAAVDDELVRRLLAHRTLLLGEALTEQNGNRLLSALILLAAEDARSDIRMLISSPGGSVPMMLALRDTMRAIPNDVSTVAVGMAASAGQFLLSAGTRGKRFALPHARILLHQGSAGIGGTAMDIAIQADDLRHTRDTVLGLIAEDTGQDLATIERDSRRDRWFTAREALDYGFVDAVVDSAEHLVPSNRRPVGLRAGR